MSYRKLIVGLFIFGAMGTQASAATVAQYTFEENPAGSSTSAAGTQLLDGSGNALHFTKDTTFGTLSWTNDLAPVQPASSTSILSNAVGVNAVVSDRYSFNKTGQLTFETWWKPNQAGTFGPLASFNSGSGNPNGWSFYQTFPSSGTFSLRLDLTDNAGTLSSYTTATTFDINSGWNHVAFTVNLATGDLSFYINGVEDTATLGDEDLDSKTFGTLSDDLDFAHFSDGGFTNNVYLDDMRISDVELLPGTGTGNGELAWNASLIPEPASLALLSLGGLMLARRPRK